MNSKEFPLYYQNMEKHVIENREKEMKPKTYNNTLSNIPGKNPKVFYKVISKIIIFEFNEK